MGLKQIFWIFIFLNLKNEIASQSELPSFTSKPMTIDELLFAEDLFPGHVIPKNMQHSEALKMFSVLVEDINILSEAHKKYQVQFEKVSDEQMLQMQLENFQDNLRLIFQHNLKADAGHFQFQLGVNNFADMSKEEIRAFLGAKDKLSIHVQSKEEDMTKAKDRPKSSSATRTLFPTRFDFRDEKIVSPVKNQKQCGSCVFFAMAALMEVLHAVKTGEIIDVSEQMMLDCATPENGCLGNEGCNGNYLEPTLQFLQDYGITPTKSYPPYAAKQGNCTMAGKKIIAQLKSWRYIEESSVDSFKTTLVKERSPVVAAFLVYHGFMFYRSGVYDMCYPPASYIGGHAILITGYDASLVDNEHWIIKNSWGIKWGEMGYFRYAAGHRTCLMERWGFSGVLK